MRLIDVDVRIDDLQRELKAGYMGCEKADYLEKLIQDYKDQPVIEAKPIIRGHWIDNGFDDLLNEPMYECSCCHNISDWSYHFCPDCGAEMNLFYEEVEKADEVDKNDL